jgi:hypothetical protein
MKRIIPALLFAVVCLSSCLDTTANFTPEVAVSPIFNTHGDTLVYRYDGMSGMYNVDSVVVGDTLMMSVGFNTIANNLISTHIGWDTTYMNVWSHFDDAILSVLLSNSDTTKLDLYFPIGYNYLALPLWIVPKKAGGTMLKFTVVSDSKFSTKEEPLVLNIIEN